MTSIESIIRIAPCLRVFINSIFNCLSYLEQSTIRTMETETIDFKFLARQFKALSNEHRLALFVKILSHEQEHGREHGCLISDMVSNWKICAPTVSHHVRTLENAQLIDVEKDGKYIIARINLDTYRVLIRLGRVRPMDEHFVHAINTDNSIDEPANQLPQPA